MIPAGWMNVDYFISPTSNTNYCVGGEGKTFMYSSTHPIRVIFDYNFAEDYDAVVSGAKSLMKQVETVAIQCSSSGSSSGTEPVDEYKYKRSPAEQDQVCRDKFGADRYWDPDKKLCTRTIAGWEKYCIEKYGSGTYWDPDKKICTRTNAGSPEDPLNCPAGSKYYKTKEGYEVCAVVDEDKLEEYVHPYAELIEKSTYYSSNYQEGKDDIEGYIIDGKKFLEAGLYEEALSMFEKANAIYPGSGMFPLIAEAKIGIESTKAEKFFVPAPAPQIREEVKPFFTEMFKGRCPDLHNAAKLVAGLSEFPLVCTGGTFVLPSNNIVSVKVADDWHVKVGEWGAKGLLKTMVSKVPAVGMLLYAEELYDTAQAGPYGARGALETLKTLTMWVESGEGTLLNGIFEVKVSCPSRECDFYHLDKKGDSFIANKIDSVLDATNFLNVKLNQNSVYLVTVYSSEDVKPKERVPGWIKNNAGWWAEGAIGDSDFTGGIQHLIKEKIIDIPDLPEQASGTAEEKVPDWVRNNAGWWADGMIGEDDFVNGIKWLVEQGIIKV